MNDACEEALNSFKPYCMFTAGALFGAGWWVWGDAVAVSAVQGEPFNAIWVVPGVVATLAILVMNCAPRSELHDSVYGDEAAVCRTRFTLFISYVFSVAAIGAAVAILLNLKSQQDKDLWIGAAGILQSCLVSAAGLVSWFFKEAGDNDSYSYI